MPKLTGFFATLPDFYKYTPDDVNKWLKNKADLFQLQNFLGNRVLYPQTVSSTEEESNWELAIVKEFASRNPSVFYTAMTRKMVLPDSIKAVFQPLNKAVMAITEVIKIESTTVVVLKSQGRYQEVGSIFKPDAPYSDESIKVTINGKDYTVKVGQLTLIEVFDRKVKLQINLNFQIMLTGGEMGIILDLRTN